MTENKAGIPSGSGMRPVKVENAALPRIDIYCSHDDSEDFAREVGYGIEEEGLPFCIAAGRYGRQDAWNASRGSGLGVTVLVEKEAISVYCRQLKKKEPLFKYFFDTAGKLEVIRENAARTIGKNDARTIGKNAARIIKNKPFLDIGE